MRSNSENTGISMLKPRHHFYIIKSCISAIFIVIIAVYANAQNISVKTDLNPKKILVGDWIKYKIEVSSSTDLKILWPVLPDTFGPFEVISRTDIDSAFSGNLIKRTQEFTLSCYDSGTMIFPRVPVFYLKKGDTGVKNILTDSFLVSVDYVKLDSTREIKPIKAPLKMPITLRELVPFIIILAIIELIAFLVFYYRYRKKNKPVVIRQRPSAPPHVTALEKLKELEEQKLWQKGEVKRYHIELTDITREFMEYRFDIHALESTTDEIIKEIRQYISDEKLLTDLKNFLEISDLVKFAKMIPLPDENEKCLQTSYELVRKSTIPENESNISDQDRKPATSNQ